MHNADMDAMSKERDMLYLKLDMYGNQDMYHVAFSNLNNICTYQNYKIFYYVESQMSSVLNKIQFA